MKIATKTVLLTIILTGIWAQIANSISHQNSWLSLNLITSLHLSTRWFTWHRRYIHLNSLMSINSLTTCLIVFTTYVKRWGHSSLIPTSTEQLFKLNLSQRLIWLHSLIRTAYSVKILFNVTLKLITSSWWTCYMLAWWQQIAFHTNSRRLYSKSFISASKNKISYS